MAKKRVQSDQKMSIMDAVDNLSEIAEIDIATEKEGHSIGVIKNLHNLNNLEDKEKEATLSIVKGSFKTVHNYFEHLYSKDKGDLKDRNVQHKIKAIMVLASEAADKLDKCTTLFKDTYQEGKIKEIREYKDLHNFYIKKILKRFEAVLASEATWEQDWAEDHDKIDIEKQGLKDLEMVKRDREYELFYIQQDDGRPFFNRNLLRHIKLVNDFDEMVMGFEGEDPLLGINTLLDHEAQGIAEEIRDIAKQELKDFYAHACNHKKIPIVGTVFKMTMSLMLACNPKNLNDHTMGKVCTRYLKDFHTFLRQILASPDYLRLVSYSSQEIDQLSQSLVHLIHAFSFAFFCHRGKKGEMLDYMLHLLKKATNGRDIKQQKSATHAVISEIFDTYDRVIAMLKKYPNGPLFKALDIFQKEGKGQGFDPINQGNPPYYLFTFSSDLFYSKCLKIPCPTFHSYINKAEIIDEFKGFLRYFETKTGCKRHLHFNLQDRTSWQEHARCQALENLQNEAEFSNQLILVTLPKKNDFYFQTKDYLDNYSTKDFLNLLEEQIKSGKECGFFFSKKLSDQTLYGFVQKILPLIHNHFFIKKELLERKERLDFIEIFYLFFTLKILDMIHPDTFTFSCKDGVDIGASSSAIFFTFVKLLEKEDAWSKEEQNHLYWILFGPALTVRERLIDYQCLSRIASALSTLSQGLFKNRAQILSEIQNLYSHKLLQKIKVIE